MIVQVSCPSCNNVGNVPEEYLGKSIRCKRCNARFALEPSRGNPALRRPVLQAPVYLEDMPPILVDVPISVLG